MFELLASVVVGFIIVCIVGVTAFFFIAGFIVFFTDREFVKKYKEYKGWRR